MNRFLFLAFIISLITSCSPSADTKHEVFAIQETIAIPTDSPTYYFPIDSAESERLEARSVGFFVNSWYSKMLFALHEPVLYHYTGEEEIYRFTWLRTFDNPVTVRVQKRGDSIRLFAKVASGAGGYEPGEIKVDTAFRISEGQWKEFKAKLTEARFWSLPTSVEDNAKDGAMWILEGVNNKQYHWVERGPTVEGYMEFIGVCDYLLKLSNVPTPSQRVYY